MSVISNFFANLSHNIKDVLFCFWESLSDNGEVVLSFSAFIVSIFALFVSWCTFRQNAFFKKSTLFQKNFDNYRELKIKHKLTYSEAISYYNLFKESLDDDECNRLEVKVNKEKKSFDASWDFHPDMGHFYSGPDEDREEHEEWIKDLEKQFINRLFDVWSTAMKSMKLL